MTPFFKHDCTKCTHLGSVHVKGTPYDLYSCPRGALGTTLMARWSDDGPDYYSAPVGCVDPLHSAAAIRIAQIAYEGEYYERT